jgi:hypothetical protein
MFVVALYLSVGPPEVMKEMSRRRGWMQGQGPGPGFRDAGRERETEGRMG